jgi:hypothetical protein
MGRRHKKSPRWLDDAGRLIQLLARLAALIELIRRSFF